MHHALGAPAPAATRTFRDRRLVEGSAKLTWRSQDGEEKVARILEPGECFGFATLLPARPCPVDLVAREGLARLAAIPG